MPRAAKCLGCTCPPCFAACLPAPGHHSHGCFCPSCLPPPLPLLQVERLRVDVETASPLSAGQTVVDIWHQSAAPKNCTVCMVRLDCVLGCGLGTTALLGCRHPCGEQQRAHQWRRLHHHRRHPRGACGPPCGGTGQQRRPDKQRNQQAA